MVPIAEYYSTGGKDLTDYESFVDEVLGLTVQELHIPDPEDREFRTPQLVHEEASNILRISYTVGPSEYEYHLGEGNGRFEPSADERNSLALGIAELRNAHNVEMNRLELVEWRDTVFELIGEEDLALEINDESVEQEDLESLSLFKARLYVNSSELISQFEDLIPGCEVVVVEGSDAPVGLELDCEQEVERGIEQQVADSLKKNY